MGETSWVSDGSGGLAKISWVSDGSGVMCKPLMGVGGLGKTSGVF